MNKNELNAITNSEETFERIIKSICNDFKEYAESGASKAIWSFEGISESIVNRVVTHFKENGFDVSENILLENGYTFSWE